MEAAVYFCVLEAMQNAGKHAGADAIVRVTVAERDGTLTFSVVDDGAGFEVVGSGGAGHGFVNMADRLGAFGGTIDVRSAPGAGTTVSGTLPSRLTSTCRSGPAGTGAAHSDGSGRSEPGGVATGLPQAAERPGARARPC